MPTPSAPTAAVTVNYLQAYSDAWNAHDIDAIMAFMSDDCVFEPGGGPERYGRRFEGRAAVRRRFVEVWTDIPDIQFTNGVHLVDGRHGCSEWTIVGTRRDGGRLEVDGCDLFTFAGDKIQSKRSYLKNRQR